MELLPAKSWAMSVAKTLDKLLCWVGETTGALDVMLGKIADFYEEEVDSAVKDLLSALEPAMIVFLGVVVGGIVISMYLPLFSLIGKLSSAH